MGKSIKVLLIEDSPLFVELARAMLAETQNIKFSLECADNLAAGIGRLSQGGIDAVLLDLTLPDSRGLDTFTQVHAAAENVPTIIYTSVDDEEFSLTALNQGAADYLVKSEVTASWLAKSLVYAIQRSRSQHGLEKAAKPDAAVVDHSLAIDRSPDSDTAWIATLHDHQLVNVTVLEQIQARLLSLLRHPDCRDVRIDFSNVEYIANAAISMLLIIHKRCKAANIRLTLAEVRPQVYEHFSSRRFDKVFEIQLSGQ